MANREIRGIFAQTYAPADVGPVALNYLDTSPTQGKVGAGGIVIVTPSGGDTVSAFSTSSSIDPIVSAASLAATGNTLPNGPSGGETRQSSAGGPPKFYRLDPMETGVGAGGAVAPVAPAALPWWVVLAAMAALF